MPARIGFTVIVNEQSTRTKHTLNQARSNLTAMLAKEQGGTREVTMAEMLSVLRHSRTSERLGIVGKLVGVGVFAALIYSYCNVLIEACFRGVR